MLRSGSGVGAEIVVEVNMITQILYCVKSMQKL